VPELILDAANFVAMGSRFFMGQGKGIVIRIGKDSVKAIL
jgi:hypothetical protein